MALQASKIKALFLDLDGVVWHGASPIGDLAATFRKIYALNLLPLVGTNNATQTPEAYCEKFASFGVEMKGVQHHGWGGMARLTDGEIHQRQAGRLQACGLGSQQRTQALERVGLQEVETGVGGQAHAGGPLFQARDSDYKEREFVAE